MVEEKKYTPQEILNEIDACRESIVKDPKNLELHMRLAHFLELGNNLQEAIQIYQSIVQTDSQHKKAYYRLGLCYSKSGFKNRAIDSLEAVLELDLTNAEIWANLGFIHWEMQNLDRARLCYVKAHENNPDDEKILQSYSLINYLIGNKEKALDSAKKLLKISKKNSIENILHLALCYNSLEKYKDAKKYYEEALSRNYDDSVFFNNYANCLKALKNFSKAEEFYLKSLQKDSNNTNFIFNYAEFLYQQKRVEESIPYFQKILQSNPNDIDALQYLADFYKEKNPKESLKLYQKVLKINSKNINALNAIANIQEKYEMYKESTTNRKRIYAIKKNHWENNFKLGKIHLKNKKIIEGWEMLKYNPFVDKKEIGLLEKLANSFSYQKKYHDEIDVLQQIVKLNPNHPFIWIRLSEIALQNQDTLRSYQYALRAKPLLEADFLFTGRLTKKLLEIDEVEKAIEISHSILKTVEIDNYIVETILKDFKKKEALESWEEKTEPIIKDKPNIKNSIDDLLLKAKI